MQNELSKAFTFRSISLISETRHETIKSLSCNFTFVHHGEGRDIFVDPEESECPARFDYSNIRGGLGRE